MIENKNLKQSITTFSFKIFGEKSLEVFDDENSFRKLNLKNTFLNKSVFSNKENNKSKIEEFELVPSFTEKNKKIDELSEEITDEIIDTLDIEKLRSSLKTKCKINQSLDQQIKILNKDFTNLLNELKEKNEESNIIIRLQDKEIQRYNKVIEELKKEINDLREKTNNIKEFQLSNLKMNKPSNYFLSIEKKEDFRISNDIKILENQFSGDSEISISCKIDNNNHITKKWRSDEKNISIIFDDFHIKFEKIEDFSNSNMGFLQKKEFKFINMVISNFSDTSLQICDLKFDSTESIIFF